MMNDDIEYPTVSISYSDGTIKHLNRKGLIEFIERPPRSVLDAVFAAELKKMINFQEVLIKEYEEKKNLIKMNFIFDFGDGKKESV